MSNYTCYGIWRKAFFLFLYLFGIVLLLLKFQWYQSLSALSLWLFNPGTLATSSASETFPCRRLAADLSYCFSCKAVKRSMTTLGIDVFAATSLWLFEAEQPGHHPLHDWWLGSPLPQSRRDMERRPNLQAKPANLLWFHKKIRCSIATCLPKSASTLHGRLPGRLDRSSLGIAIVQRETGQISVRQPAEHSCTRRTQIADHLQPTHEGRNNLNKHAIKNL